MWYWTDVWLKMSKIVECIIFSNGNVISFDEKGEQAPECQGFILDIAEKLKECCDENTRWKLGEFGRWTYGANLSWYWEKKKREQKT